MSLLQIIVLAVVQGITEFLPISSSAHLILVPMVWDWPDQGLLLDVAVHVGTLFAVLLYFHKDVWQLILGAADLIRGRMSPRAKLLLLLGVATLPVVGAGYVFARNGWMDALRSAEVIGWTTLGFGLLLYVSDRVGMTLKRTDHLGVPDAVMVGIAQTLALIPGTSRSGITMTAARFLGFERREAARLSMLMSIPTIIAAGGLAGLELYQAGDATLTMAALTAGVLALATALVAIAVLMRWLERASFTPFVIYRVMLGFGLLYWVYA